ncbi:MAG: metal-dependent phosphohydrolase [bacterium]|nr:metal-dependent phosphohydrolase [bacterium]
MLFNYRYLMIQRFAAGLETEYKNAYGELETAYGGLVNWIGRLALENISNSDMLYHDVEHTMLVTTVGQQILVGKHLTEGGVTPSDWAHFIAALLCHDIGYVRGICRGDRKGIYATGVDDDTIELPPGSTDAALTPYHVDRSKLFVQERFGGEGLIDLQADQIANYIEMTRFPPPDEPAYKDTKGYPGLLRAADFIGQLGDPDYLRKIPALFYEFEQFGANEKMGYKNPGDMRTGFAGFFWNVVSPYIQDAIQYLEVTQDGKHWVANLHSHVFEVEHAIG